MRKLPVRELVRFGLVGVLSNAVYVCALILLRRWTLPWWLATGAAYATSMLVNYVAQRAFTFRSARPHHQAGGRYLVLMLSCLVLNSCLMEIFMSQGLLHPVIAPAIALVIVTAISYLGQKRWVFQASA